MRRKVISAVVAVIGVFAAAADMLLLFAGGPARTASSSAASGAPLGSSGTGASGGASGGSSGTASGDGSASADGSGTSSDASSDGASGASDDATASDGAFEDGTYTGAVVATSKGDVQVQVTVSGGKVTQVVAVKYPNDNPRSLGIAQKAIPQLSDEAVQAQSADIQMVSGATETSTGFIGSLQDALDQAK
ncbi:FMN-binding protein [Bifidobacterium parmae]|uniref:FMN-binding protein n=1 Tax=Bifidobacterium parmae TaxID=361854 RepID=A0A2N5J5U5_9BIFI|nr:FMN-binding protein [Bifidobacterium parmae]PLS29576.1 FMN-binding protein [Bifidobacterium parmae]